MKSPSPAFSFYPKDIITDENTSAQTHEEFGAYVRLLCHAWLEESIPADPVRLARILKVPAKTFARIWPAIAPCWEEHDGRLYQRRLERERQKQRERSSLNAERGRKGGRPLKSTEEESRGFPDGFPREKPGESLPSPSPSPLTDACLPARAREAKGEGQENRKVQDQTAAVREECRTLLVDASRASGIPPDVLLAQASKTSRGRLITNLDGCGSAEWLRVTLDRLLQIRLDAEAATAVSPPARASPDVLRRENAAMAMIRGGLQVGEGKKR